MTGMLAGVTSVTEANCVLDAGVDIVDIKNPNDGALGALSLDRVEQIVREMDGRLPCSATIGDIGIDDHDISEKILNMSATGVDYVKVGLFASSASPQFLESLRQVTMKHIRVVLVMFAEDYRELTQLEPLIDSGLSGIMLDTRNKVGGGLCDKLDTVTLQAFVHCVREAGLLCGLAGSLRHENIETLLQLIPDYLGFRVALCCAGNRINALDPERVKKIRSAIPHSGYINYDQDKYHLASIR